MATTPNVTDSEVEKTANDEIPGDEYPGDAEIKRMLIVLMTLHDFDDDREVVHKAFYKIPECKKVDVLYGFFKDKDESQELRDYALFTLFINTASIVSTLEAMGRLEWFCDALIEEYNIEASAIVRERIAASIGSIYGTRKDKWTTLDQLMADWISSNDESLQLKALNLMKGFHCKLPGVKNLIVKSIMGSNPVMRKAALEALEYNDVDTDTLEMLLPVFIMLGEKGCCALPPELVNDAPWTDQVQCNGEHSFAVDRLYSLTTDACGGFQRESAKSTKEYRLLTEHMERIVSVATETILHEVDCEQGNGRYSALQILSELSEEFAARFPNGLIYDIVISCLIAVARELASCLEPCQSPNPAIMEFNFNFAVSRANWYAKPILSRIGPERAGEHLLNVAEAFLKSDDWSRRAAAMICWSILDREWKDDRFFLLVDKGTDGLIDEHPRVRAAAADLLATLFRGNAIDGDSDRLREMVSSLVTLVSDASPQVRASALVALAYFRSSLGHLTGHYSVLIPRLIAVLYEPPTNQAKVAIHACAIDIIYHLAVLVEKERFMQDYPVVERALCAHLASLDSSFKQFGLVCASAERLCQVVEGDCKLKRTLASLRA